MFVLIEDNKTQQLTSPKRYLLFFITPKKGRKGPKGENSSPL
jgi:hypothetical protein